MSTPSIMTGDPTIDGIINWITNGGSLQSPGAILVIGTIIKVALIPLITRACVKFNINFTGPNKLHGVIGCGFLVVAAINLVTRQHLSLGDTFLMGVQAGIAAIGIHEASGTLSAASVKPEMLVAQLGTFQPQEAPKDKP